MMCIRSPPPPPRRGTEKPESTAKETLAFERCVVPTVEGCFNERYCSICVVCSMGTLDADWFCLLDRLALVWTRNICSKCITSCCHDTSLFLPVNSCMPIRVLQLLHGFQMQLDLFGRPGLSLLTCTTTQSLLRRRNIAVMSCSKTCTYDPCPRSLCSGLETAGLSCSFLNPTLPHDWGRQ